jgi:prefoldin subunit 5
MAKKITIDSLAGMIGKGFAGVDKKLEEMNKDINKRFDRIENILIKQQNDKIAKLEERMNRIEEALVIK